MTCSPPLPGVIAHIRAQLWLQAQTCFAPVPLPGPEIVMTAPLPVLEKTNHRAPHALRAVLLGCGVVGGGVVTALPQGVQLSGVLARVRRGGIPARTPVFSALSDLQTLRPNLVVETLPDGVLAENALDWAVGIGAHVVTANKAVAARRPDLAAKASQHGTAFLCSAAVGGGVPVLETIARLRVSGTKIVEISGVLNGTSNFVLDRMADGEALTDAVHAAQLAGFAEADPGADLDGLDAANKLSLIARQAWGIDLPPDKIETESIRDLPGGAAQGAAREGRRLRQVACITKQGDTLSARVTLDALPLENPLARARLEGNVVVLKSVDRPPLILSGKGAGRIPTAASVVGDIRTILSGRWA